MLYIDHHTAGEYFVTDQINRALTANCRTGGTYQQMAQNRSKHVREEGPQRAASARAAEPSDCAHIKRIESAMSKIARALPSNASLSSVWTRLEDMHHQAITNHKNETEAQTRARAWLEAQKEIPSRRSAMSDSGKPAP